MKRFLLLSVLSVALSFVASAMGPSRDSYKILQFTDLHLNTKHPEELAKALSRMDRIVAQEAPDFIVVTGDMALRKPSGAIIQQLVEQLDSYGVPWCVTYGNHDAEQGLSRAEMSALYVAGKNTVNTLAENGELADMKIPVVINGKEEWDLFVMDSRDYSSFKDEKGCKYGYFSPAQVAWMRENSNPELPSLAFFHIPLCEYVDAWSGMDNSRIGEADEEHCIGIRGESVSHGALNTGMFAAMKEGGSVVGCFCGHDHDNDFMACYKGIALCYGRFTGTNSTYNNIIPGARVIVLRPGTRTFETWIRDDYGRCVSHAATDGSRVSGAATRPKGGTYGTFVPMDME